ncbi:potassium channel protein [Luteolibacter yonseiensis]|uniref:Potassium channel protein n=1 Tax=Luteolibacter yonseiensis TaxID=1144680 RepID=A0A934VDU3_9BACT|nr:potassium channel protein [Luteolibacter yonseiensis]MBK1818391.1 potassium channel protein [Luteolibacter yonseiensis]
MKSLVAVIAAFMGNRSSRSNFKTLLRLISLLVFLVILYSVLFHLVMEREGQHFSWITGVYWTLTVMTTLGFGDITFHGDLGRFFSICVLMTGVMFLLVILPFTFIEFFYAPWMKAQASARTPRELPADRRNHVIFTNYDPITAALIPLLEKYGHPHVVLCQNITEGLELYEQGLSVAVGDLDDPETYRKMRLPQAAMLVATRSDVLNTNITFTAREMAEHVPIVASASSDNSRDVLELAGATHVLRMERTMGQALARRVIGKDCEAHVIGEMDGLQIAEANAAGTELEGLTLANCGIRSRTGVNVIGVWDHGRLTTAEPEMVIRRQTVLVLAGTAGQIAAYDATFGLKVCGQSHVVIVGGGRVGRITSEILKEAGLSTTIIEKLPARVTDHPEAVVGDATKMDVLKAARTREADTIIITSHDDDLNISLTIFFRRLRENFQIISRCTLDRNVQTLHRAGANLVLSSASMGANTIFNMIREDDNLLLAEGVFIFPSPVPRRMAGRRLADCAVRTETGCTIIAVENNGARTVNPEPDLILPAKGKLLLIGTLEAEEKFLKAFQSELAPVGLRRYWKRSAKA